MRVVRKLQTLSAQLMPPRAHSGWFSGSRLGWPRLRLLPAELLGAPRVRAGTSTARAGLQAGSQRCCHQVREEFFYYVVCFIFSHSEITSEIFLGAFRVRIKRLLGRDQVWGNVYQKRLPGKALIQQEGGSDVIY